MFFFFKLFWIAILSLFFFFNIQTTFIVEHFYRVSLSYEKSFKIFILFLF